MSITGPGSITAANVAAQTNMMNQLNTLSEELGTGQAAQTYSDLGPQAGLALALSRPAFRHQRLQRDRDHRRHDAEHRAVGVDPARQCRQRGCAGDQPTGRFRARRYRSDDDAAIGGELPRRNTFAAQHPGRRQLHFFRQRGEPALGRQRQRNSQRQRRAGRAHAIDRRTATGRSRRDRAWPADRRRDRWGRDAQPRRFAIRLPAREREFESDRRDRVSAIRLAADALGRSRVQSECRRLDRVQPHAARRIEPDNHAASDRKLAAGRQPVHHRRVAGRHRGQSANRVDGRHRQSGADRAAGRLRHRRRR